jgi:chitin disaccharide deacetylase
MKNNSCNCFKKSVILTFCVLFISVFTVGSSSAQEKITNAEKLGFPKGKKILLLHCDDAGMCEEANIAVQSYILKGDVLSAAVMMPCPNAADMVEWAKKKPHR